MFISKLSKNIFGTLILACFLIFFPLPVAAQCGGTFFQRSATTLTTANGFAVYSTDMTGDGIPDLVGYTANQTSSNSGINRLMISPANGNGTFGAPIFFNAPAQTTFTTFITGDFDNDNFKDIITGVQTAPTSYIIYRNNGDGTFTASPLRPYNNGNFFFLLDINNDGKGDLITDFGGIGADIRYSLGNGDGTFQSAVPLVMNRNILPGDFNTDGKIDFIAGTTLLINLGSGLFSTVSNVLTLANGEVIRDVRDFSGDGKPDILTVTQSSTVKISLLTNLGSNNFQRADYTIASNQQNAEWYGNVFVGNFGGSASPDVLYSADFQIKTIVYTNDGAGTLSAQTYNYKFNAKFAGDFDNDGKADAVRVSEGNFSPLTPHKFFAELSLIVQKNVCGQPGQTRIVDFNGNASTDFSYWTPADGTWAALGSSTVNWGLGSLGDIPTPGDFDGDGKTDHAIYRNSTGVWWVRRSSDGNSFAIQFGVTGDKPVVGDYDGDTISDIAVFRPSDGNWYVLFMGTQSYTIVHWGQDGDKPVPEDYDGDGKTDLAVFRPSNGTWYYLKSSDLNFVALQFGLSADKPVAADYDGDGRADIAVYRESESVLHILRSFNLAYAGFAFGVSGDIPQPGDYDGDFVFDLGIYRPSAQRWYTTISLEQTNFGASNVVPTSSILRIE
jgi:hypothetical protein